MGLKIKINNQNFNATNTTNNESIKTQSFKIFFYKKSNLFFNTYMS